MPPRFIVLIDLSDPYLRAFSQWAEAHEYKLIVASASSLGMMNTATAALAVVGVSGETDTAPERLRSIRKALPACPFVLLARDIAIDSVVALMRSGAAEVIGLPAAAADVVARSSLHALVPCSDGELIGHSPAVERLRREIEAVAPLRSTVLLTGETGVGKGVAARRIHELSACQARPFVHLDCAALAPSIVESELFGHERGSYTGAASARAGRFELAADGTIFLDEIGDLDPNLQAKLLRVLQDREFERLGGTTTRVMAARVIAATNRDLRESVAKGRFRADLYFRLDVFRIQVPPLRARKSDIPALARAALQRIGERLQITVPSLPDSFYARLCEQPWPGNVRELLNALERMLIRLQMGLPDENSTEDALGGCTSEEEPNCAENSAGEHERIETALRAVGGNVSRAARRLGVARSTLRYKIKCNDLIHLIPHD